MKLNKKILGLASVGILGIGMFWVAGTSVVPRMMATMVKASPITKISLNNSIVIGEKILATANSKDVVRVSAFIMDKDGRGVAKRIVTMGARGLETQEAITDNNGKATGEFKSNTKGQYTIEVTVDGSPLNKNVMVTFVED
jgi:hypothetical protein